MRFGKSECRVHDNVRRLVRDFVGLSLAGFQIQNFAPLLVAFETEKS